MSKDMPILFSAPMVRALLAGRKTMTRRLAHLKPRISIQVGDGPIEPIMVESNWQKVKAGDRLWVREAAAFIWPDEVQPERKQDCIPEYRADTDGKCLPGNWPDEEKADPDCPKWCPSIHMPRWASRLTLIVTGVKIEHVQNISDADAITEGVETWRAGWSQKETALAFLRGLEASFETKQGTVAQRLFYLLWTSLHGDESWAENPEVVAITFRVIKANIDTPEARIAA